jgi:hypothetical protein
MDKTILIQSFIDDTISKDNEKKRKDYKQSSFHASSLGNCLRGTYLQRLGIEPDEPLKVATLRKFKAGELFEEWLIDLLKRNKNIKKVEQQIRVESKLYNLSGRLDALLTYQDDSQEVMECKSQHSKSFWFNIHNGNKPARHQEMQLWIYLKLLKIENGKLVLLSKDDLSVQEYPVKLEDKELAKEVIDIMNLLNTAWKEQNPLLLPLPEEKWKAKFCQYHKHCVDEEYLKSLCQK